MTGLKEGWGGPGQGAKNAVALLSHWDTPNVDKAFLRPSMTMTTMATGHHDSRQVVSLFVRTKKTVKSLQSPCCSYAAKVRLVAFSRKIVVVVAIIVCFCVCTIVSTVRVTYCFLLHSLCFLFFFSCCCFFAFFSCRVLFYLMPSSKNLFASIYVDDFVLIHIFENVGSVH